MFKARRDAINAASKARKFGLILSTLGRQGSPKVLEVTREIVIVSYNPWSRTSQIPLSPLFDHHVSEWNDSSVYYDHFSVTIPGGYCSIIIFYVRMCYSRARCLLSLGDRRILHLLGLILRLTFSIVYDLFLFRCVAFFKIFSCNVTPFSCY